MCICRVRGSVPLLRVVVMLTAYESKFLNTASPSLSESGQTTCHFHEDPLREPKSVLQLLSERVHAPESSERFE